jgi:hypothetical protein
VNHDPVYDLGMRLHISSNKRMNLMSFINFRNDSRSPPSGISVFRDGQALHSDKALVALSFDVPDGAPVLTFNQTK